jgi:CubicO group peptidase (beta-lactamase class C family)
LRTRAIIYTNNPKPSRRMRTVRTLALFAALIVASWPAAHAQSAPLQGFDAYITKAMQEWKVPGLAIAVVKNDSVIFIKGYGTRALGTQQPVDDHTLFAIGSVSKAFTATLVAMLVDEGKMRWDDAATTYLPSLQMYDPYVSRELTVRDLLTHRSGLARGDLMWYATDYSADEILRRVRFLRPSWSMRSRYGYQNIMYLAAGQAVAKVAGKSWDDVLRERILNPLGMTETNSSTRVLPRLNNVATPHQEIDDTLRVIPWHNIDAIGPAGSINSSASDMAKWIRFHLAQGKVAGKSLVSAGALGETHTPQMVVQLSADSKQINPYTHLASYGMGWVIQDYRGREIHQHGGNIDGMSALAAILPEEKLGVVVLTNANGSPMPSIAMYRVVDAMLAQPARDWSAEYMKVRTKNIAMGKETEAKRLAQRAVGTKPSLSLDKYAGVYADSMYGEVRVAQDNGRLTAKYGTMFDGELEHWHYDTFRARWNTRSMGRTFVTFALDADGKVRGLEFEGMGSFNRKPDAPDTTRKIVLAAADAAKLTGAFVSQTPAMTIEVQNVDGALKLTIPGQPVYTLLADSPTRFRVTGPPSMPAGFFLEYELAGSAVRSVRLIQPTPRPTLVFAPKK